MIKGCSIPLINSKDTTRLSFPLGIGPPAKCFNLASFSQVGGQLGFSTKPCIQSKLGGLSHLVCKAKSNVFCHCFWASSKVSAFWQLGSLETNLWLVLLGQHCCQFLNHGIHLTRQSRQFLWVRRNLEVLSGFFESVAVTFFQFLSLIDISEPAVDQTIEFAIQFCTFWCKVHFSGTKTVGSSSIFSSLLEHLT